MREVHLRIFLRAQAETCGSYTTLPRRIAGSPVVLPNAAKISHLMKAFGEWLLAAEITPATSFEVHFRLTSIHPFGDGNGHTARLLMNLLLLREGYRPVAVRPNDRKAYLDTLQHESMTGDLKPFQHFMHRRLDATLEGVLECVGTIS